MTDVAWNWQGRIDVHCKRQQMTTDCTPTRCWAHAAECCHLPVFLHVCHIPEITETIAHENLHIYNQGKNSSNHFNRIGNIMCKVFLNMTTTKTIMKFCVTLKQQELLFYTKNSQERVSPNSIQWVTHSLNYWNQNNGNTNLVFSRLQFTFLLCFCLCIDSITTKENHQLEIDSNCGRSPANTNQ